jgi:ribosome-associated protein
MSRKPKKGYFVRGQFVAEGSELDLELKRELKGDTDISRTDLKRESTELQKLGEALLDLRAEILASLALPEKLLDALEQARRISNFEGRRRQMQFVGKLMRQLDREAVDAVRQALQEQHQGSARQTQRLHAAEQWRARLIAEDDAVAQWINSFPDTDSQQLRALVRQARKDAGPLDKTAISQGLAPRQGRAFRDLFQLIKNQLDGAPSTGESHGSSL